MDVAFDHQRDSQAELAVPEPDLQLGEILGPVAELYLTPHQCLVHLVLVALEAHGRSPADAAAGCHKKAERSSSGSAARWPPRWKRSSGDSPVSAWRRRLR